MNKETYRLVHSRRRGMAVAVGETATTTGKSASGDARARRTSRSASIATLAAALGSMPAIPWAQIAPTPGTPTHVIQTPNGLPQVNIAAPSGAGVSVNNYDRFDVHRNGALLNNSPAMVHTQQAGMINGNPNFGPGQSARIIVNQVNSTAASQIRGYVEVAGNRAEVVLANPAGIVVDGGGFINTSRATLTTGRPYYGADGSLAGYHVNRGLITVQGAGLDASSVDQVDLIARAVQANAAIHAKKLNVIAGASQVDRDTLAATPIEGDGAAPGVAIDVSQLGGMYAERILLVSNERGVGVANAGTIAAQSGDLTLQSNGQLVLGGKTNATGNLAITAQGGIRNDGTTYGQRNVSVSTTGTLSNNGALAARHALNVSADSVASTGSLGAGVNADGAVTHDGDLIVTATGQLTANGRNVAGGNVAFTGSGIDLSGSKTAANANVSLLAHAGGLNLTNATTSAQRAIDARAAGVLVNDHGTLSSQAGTTLAARALSNRGGQLSAVGPLAIDTSGRLENQGGTLVTDGALTLSAGDIANRAGTMQSGGALSVKGASLDNSAGRIVSLNGDGLTLSATGRLTNAGGTTATGVQGGVIGGNGDVTVQAGRVMNHGSLTAQHALQVTAALVDNRDGAMAADRLNVKTTDLHNARGTLTQYGSQETTVDVSGTLDNASGTIQTNGTNLTLAPAALDNASGMIVHAGTGTLALMPGLGSGLLTNAGGTILSRGTIGLSAGAFDNIGGTLAALGSISARIGGELNNTGGALAANGDVTLDAGSMTNGRGGQLNGANVLLRANSLNNDGGGITGAGGDVGITTAGAVSNAGGQIGAMRDLSIRASTLYGGGAYSAANDLALYLRGDFTNTSDYQFNAGRNLAFTLPGTFNNDAGLMSVNDLSVDAGDVVNSGAMAAGGRLRTQSNTLINTGTLVGASVSLSAASALANVGPTALIGASASDGLLELLAQNIENRDDTTTTDTPALTAIYGLGRVVLAGGKDAAGQYTKAAHILNQSGLIQSDGDMALHADLVTNTRREMQTAWTSQVDATLLERLGISLSGRTGQVGVKDPDSIGGVYVEPPHGGEYNSTYQYTTYTGTPLANLVSKISPAAQIVVGGSLNASSVDTFQNYWSQVTAAGDIEIPRTLDQDSWRGQLAPQVKVTYTGKYWYRNYDGTKFWSYSFCDTPGCNAPSDIREYALPSYESSFVANGTLSGTGVSIDNPAGNAGRPPIGLPPGVDVGAVGGGIDRVIASATAVDVLKNLTIPQGGLFHPNPAPNANYLIETNPAFTSRRAFMSSDYYLQQLGLNPEQTAKRVGDGFYEQWLVRNQLTSLTGKAVLGPYTDIESMYQALLSSGAALSKSLDLPLGASLSAEQVAQLTSNVVLLETRVVDGQSVLVPVVYLAQASRQDMNGPLIAGGNVDLKDVRSFSNSGTLRAADSLSIGGRSLDNRFGALQSGGRMTLVTTGTVDLTSASVKAGGLALAAGGDLILDTATHTRSQASADGATRVSTTLGPQAGIDVAGDAAIATGGSFRQNAGNLSVGGDLGMQVGGDWTLGAQQVGEHKVVERANGVSDTEVNRSIGSAVKVGGKSAIVVGRDLTAKGAQIELGGGGAVVAGGTVTLGVASATSTVNSTSSGNEGSRGYAESLHTSDQALSGTTLTGGESVAIVAGKDLNVIGSAIGLDKGNVTLAAAGDVNIGAATGTHELNAHETHSRSGVVSGTKVASGIDQTMTLNQGSLVSADGVTIAAGRDLIIQGSTVVGTNDVALSAARNVTVATTQDTLASSSYYQKKETGLMSGGGLSVSVGSSSLKTTSQTSEVSNNGSTIGSLNGNLSIVAGNDLRVTGSDLIAARNISGTGANVTIDAAQATGHRAQTQEVSKSGLTLALKAPVIDAVSNVVGQSRAAGKSQDGRAAALHGMAAASGAIDAVGAGAAALAGGATPEFKVELSVGSSHSKSAFSEDSVTNRGSNVNAGGTVAFAATGNGQAGSGNVTIAGSNVNASDVILAAKNDVNIVNTTDTDSTRSTNESKSASVGVSVGTGGFGISAAMSKANGDGNSDLATQNNSHVNAANGVTIISGGDTNIIGSNVKGNQVNADVGGNLNIASVQDTLASAAHQSSSGGGFSISQGGASASFSQSKGNATGSYAGVDEQAGIQAGDEGFNINVTGNTDLKGGLIASSADASKNSLTTGSLTFSDIQNQSHYDASSSGFSAGATTGDGGMNYSTHGSASGKNAGGAAPMLGQNDSGSDSATTKSGVSAGTVTITDSANQKQDAASLSRDTTNTNGTVAKLPDVQNLLANQSDMMAAASAAGEAVSRRIGDYADKMMKDAAANGDQAGVDAWKEGGANRALMQGAGAALVTGLAGGNAVGGAAGAAVASIAAGKLNELSSAIAGSDPTGNANMNQALGNIVANVIATGAGAAVGGDAGAFSGYNVDRFNRQLHSEEKKVIHELANGDPNKEHRLEAAGCALVHCAAEYAPGTADYAKYSALEQEGAGYTAEQTQLKNYNGTYFAASGYGGMVKLTPASGLFQYSTDDLRADSNAFVSNVLSTRPGKLDYVSIGGAAFGSSAGISINLHNGNVYLGGGGAVPVVPGASVTVGVIPTAANQAPTIQADKTDNFLAGASLGVNMCAYGACVGGNHAFGGDTSVEVGVGFGGITRAPNLGGGGSTSVSFPVFTIPGMQPKRR
ncbi:hemagglutinin repeat-containing protein [Burkholderia sp. BCCIQ04A]|uniref:Hemagglutinin repeat-containing protein n=2 Tax=Burkholderia TaxID=32008 RepID=A0ABU5WY67_9BURK|nr:hemagglutinin repeat-containing protein [Burkholderia anthinoferrum]MDF3114581.1 hemagglutinin repeat-containing protein [Burkholderia semiarida]MEB2504441.1 hemagglutinin repeat-containing protein [Burkholderia anthinoferrum]MEB2583911.1 hemagglutinin repeat-containing protein [Burkholderia anthinoferrum]MEB2633664.1 hemagglutinin repeat-containing protein [Burkholderia anthinoferrum]